MVQTKFDILVIKTALLQQTYTGVSYQYKVNDGRQKESSFDNQGLPTELRGCQAIDS